MIKMMIVKPVVLALSPTALPENIVPRESFEDTVSKILEIYEVYQTSKKYSKLSDLF